MRLLLFAALLPTLLPAQSDFLKDPDIVWAAEIEQDWIVDIPSLEDEWDEGIITLKHLRSRENELCWSSPYLADLVFQAVERGELFIFKDPDLNVRTNIFEACNCTGTVITFDPKTYEEEIKAAYSPRLPFHNVKAWRLRQIVAFNRKNTKWSTHVISIAPLVERRIWGQDSRELYPMFWLKPDNRRQKLDSRQIVWAKKTVSDKQPKANISASLLTTLKAKSGFQSPLPHVLRILVTDAKSPFYDSWGGSPLRLEERKRILAKTDTVFSIVPQSTEEKIEILHENINADSIHQIRLVQTWYWNVRRHRLSICLDAVAPLKDVFNYMGEFRYTTPLFYQRSKR